MNVAIEQNDIVLINILNWLNSNLLELMFVLTAVVRALLGSHVGKPSSAYGWSGSFSPGSPVFAHIDERSARYKWNILERAVKPKLKKKKKKKKKKEKRCLFP